MLRSMLALTLAWALAPAFANESCINCHEAITPAVVTDWQISQHAENEIGCDACHGTPHAEDGEGAQHVTAETCAGCHEQRFNEYKAGKHALAWAAMEAMPTTHFKPFEMIGGGKGCGGCHRVGLKSAETIAELKSRGSSWGHAACDSCHTRHTFSVAEAREPEACASCHMGFDHPQWEMYSTSKHGVRHALKRDGVLPEGAAAPTCQDCHMADGDHEVRTAWGFLAVRTNGLAPYPGESEQWWADRVTILQGLGVLDPEGKPTARLDVVAQAQVARLSADEFNAERDKMIAACSNCHSPSLVTEELAKADGVIEKVDHLMAEAIREVAGLYTDGILEKPDNYAYAFPDLLTFHDAPTPIENRLFTMHLKHRMRAFQGAFHMNPDYTLWYGWSEMIQDLDEIRAMAKEMRADHEKN